MSGPQYSTLLAIILLSGIAASGKKGSEGHYWVAVLLCGAFVGYTLASMIGGSA